MNEPVRSLRRLSVAIVARNAAAIIERTILSAHRVASEVLVVDAGSTDDTVAIARTHGCLVHLHEWEDSFAEARNAALRLVSGDWILWLDAGETIEEATAEQLVPFVKQFAAIDRVYQLPVVVPAEPGLVGGEQVYRVRLHPRRPGMQFQSRVREVLDKSLFAFGMSVESLPLPIQRGIEDHDFEVKAAKARRNIKLADLQLTERGPSAEMHNCLGEAFQSLGETERARVHYEQATQLAKAGTREHLEAYYGLLTAIDGETDDREKQLALCMQGVEHFPLDAQLLTALGGYLQSLEQPELAIRAYTLAWRSGQIEQTLWHLPDIQQIAAHCESILLASLGRGEEAVQMLEEALRRMPGAPRLLKQLIELQTRLGNFEGAIHAVDQLPEPEFDRARWQSAVSGLASFSQGNWITADLLLTAACEQGIAEPLFLRTWVESRIQRGLRSAAQQALAVYQQVAPAHEAIARLAAAVSILPPDVPAVSPAKEPIKPLSKENRRFDRPGPLAARKPAPKTSSSGSAAASAGESSEPPVG